jgi:opacity protein-like surface antigen
MPRLLSVYGTALILLAAASDISAQVVVQRQMPERLGVGGALGRSTNGDLPSGDEGLDVAFSVETPLGRPWRLRGDVGRVRWPFEFHQAGFRVTTNDRMTLTRSTLSLLMVGPPSAILQLRLYAGIGGGLYHYTFDHGYTRSSNRGGFHALAGLEVVPGDRVAITGELQLHVIDGPTTGPVPPGRDGQVFGSVILGLREAVCFKLRF